MFQEAVTLLGNTAAKINSAKHKDIAVLCNNNIDQLLFPD